MKKISILFLILFSISYAKASDCNVFIEYSKPCKNTLMTRCLTATTSTFEENQLTRKGYNVVAFVDDASLFFKSNFFGFEPRLLIGDSSTGYHQTLKLIQLFTEKSLEVHGFSNSLFGASKAATTEAWEKFPRCEDLIQ